MPMSARTPNVTRRIALRLASGGLAAALVTHGRQPVQAADAATLEANKTIVRRVFAEAINGDNPAVSGELFAPDFVDHESWAGYVPGPAGMRLTLEQFHAVFPDVTVTVDAAVAEGDLVAIMETWRGTHPPAGTHVVGRTMHFIRIADGRISEAWSAGWEWLAQMGNRSMSRGT